MSVQFVRYQGEIDWPVFAKASDLVLSGMTYHCRESIKAVGGIWDADDKVWRIDIESKLPHEKNLVIAHASRWHRSGVVVEAVVPDRTPGQNGSSAHSFDDLDS